MQVAFYKGRTRLFNRVVSWWLNGPYSHGELVFGTDSDGVSECASCSFMDDGVRPKYITLNPEHWDIIEVDGDEAYARAMLKKHRNTKYDTFGLLGLVWRRGKGDPNKLWCTEWIAMALGYEEAWRFDPMVLFVSLKKKSLNESISA